MRHLLTCLTFVAVLQPWAGLADQGTGRNQSVAPDRNQTRAQTVPEEACFGDSYESDKDMNEGNTITEKEILLLINPPRT